MSWENTAGNAVGTACGRPSNTPQVAMEREPTINVLAEAEKVLYEALEATRALSHKLDGVSTPVETAGKSDMVPSLTTYATSIRQLAMKIRGELGFHHSVLG